jgi:cation diffusion facilitator CzcD-associated flavoprotein CzcO
MTTQKNNNHFDVLIIGAGLSGIGAAHYIQTRCPDRSYAILEMRDAIGGTWDLFRYPGIRSDSDMYTLGYAFRPWKEAKAIADGFSILNYIRQTAIDEEIDKKIQFNRRLVLANWSSKDKVWSIETSSKNKETNEEETINYSCNFLLMCSGYYNYDEGYTPDFDGISDFEGKIIHPQKWNLDSNIDYQDKRVVVIGSGATAVTLVPELAKKAKLVTMLQRSPTYIISQPSKDKVADFFRNVFPSKIAYQFNRWKNVLFSLFFYKLAINNPNFVKKYIKKQTRKTLGKNYDVDKHFTPKYDPWKQRLCLVPDNDLFDAIKSKKAKIITDTIQKFTKKGILLKSGKEIEADLIVTATGLKLDIMSGITLKKDNKKLKLPNHYMYRGMMFSDIPNLAIFVGYTNASWTLKTDLTCVYVCRLLNHMRKNKYEVCTPYLTQELEDTFSDEPMLDFNSSYVLRSIDALPKQGSKIPWKLNQNYPLDIMTIKYSSLKDEALKYN